MELAPELCLGGLHVVALPQPRQVRGEAGLHVIVDFGWSGRGPREEEQQRP